MIDMLSLLPQYTPDQFDSRHRLVLSLRSERNTLCRDRGPLGRRASRRRQPLPWTKCCAGKPSILSGKRRETR